MSFSRLASSKPASSTLTTLYTESSSTNSAIMLNMVNSSNLDNDTVYVYIGDSGDSNGQSDNLIYYGVIEPKSIIQIGGLALGSSQFIEVKSDSGYVVFALFGSSV